MSPISCENLIHLHINKAVTYLLNYLLQADFKWTGRQLVHGFANQVQRQKAFCHKAYGF